MTKILDRHTLEKYGMVFFKFRAWIAVPFFVMLVLLSRRMVYPALAYAGLVTGFAVRIWAAGYIGPSARTTSFQTVFRINCGPFRYLKHPLYIGNFFLVVGTVVLYNPPFWYAMILVVLFTVMYGMIIVSEQAHLRRLPEKKIRFELKRCTGELSTAAMLIVLVVIHVIVPKNIII